MQIIKENSEEGVVFLELGNDLIGHHARIFQELCWKLSAEGIKQMVLNFQNVNSIDSLGISEICRMIEKGVGVRLINVSHSVISFLQFYTSNTLEHVYSNEYEAIKLFPQDKPASGMKHWIEKRKFKRKNTIFKVYFKCLESTAGNNKTIEDVTHNNEAMEGVAQNLSGGGLLLFSLTDGSLSPSWKRFSLRLLIPEPFAPFCTNGKLVRSIPGEESWKMGIMFDQIDKADRNKIVDHIYNND